MEQPLWGDKSNCEYFLQTVKCGWYDAPKLGSTMYLYHWDQMKYYLGPTGGFLCPSLKDIREYISSKEGHIHYECIGSCGLITLLVSYPTSIPESLREGT